MAKAVRVDERFMVYILKLIDNGYKKFDLRNRDGTIAYSIEGSSVRDRSGKLVGWITGNTVRNSEGAVAYMISGNEIIGDGGIRAELDGDSIRDERGILIGSIDGDGIRDRSGKFVSIKNNHDSININYAMIREVCPVLENITRQESVNDIIKRDLSVPESVNDELKRKYRGMNIV
jgi:hypothetical protein